MHSDDGARNYANAVVGDRAWAVGPDEVRDLLEKAYLAGKHVGIQLVGSATAQALNRHHRDREPIEGLY